MAAATLDPKALVVPLAALGVGWTVGGPPDSMTEGVITSYTANYTKGARGAAQVASFQVLVSPNPAIANAVLNGNLGQETTAGWTAAPSSGLGDGAAYRIRLSKDAAVGIGYLFVDGPLTAEVVVAGPTSQEQDLDATARSFADLQQTRFQAALSTSGPAPISTPTPTRPADPDPARAPATPSIATAPVATASADPLIASCPAAETPHFSSGFASLREQVGDRMGEPSECEHLALNSGDTLQQTTRGLAFYRKETNTPTFTDGTTHWALTADGLVTWTGDSVEPPDALPAA